MFIVSEIMRGMAGECKSETSWHFFLVAAKGEARRLRCGIAQIRARDMDGNIDASVSSGPLLEVKE